MDSREACRAGASLPPIATCRAESQRTVRRLQNREGRQPQPGKVRLLATPSAHVSAAGSRGSDNRRMTAHSAADLPPGWLRVPIGPGSEGWITMSAERTVLVVIRTITTASWLLDILPELLGDARVQVLFTMDEDTSAFDDGVLDVLRQIRGKLVPWSQAVETEFDLAIAASPNGGLDRLRSPLLLTSHGIGFTKTAAVPERGIPPLPRSRRGRVPRTTVALSHDEQRGQWAHSPSGDFRTEVVGDPWFDRLSASLGRRDIYHAALGVVRAASDRRLVDVGSPFAPRRASRLAVAIVGRTAGGRVPGRRGAPPEHLVRPWGLASANVAARGDGGGADAATALRRLALGPRRRGLPHRRPWLGDALRSGDRYAGVAGRLRHGRGRGRHADGGLRTPRAGLRRSPLPRAARVAQLQPRSSPLRRSGSAFVRQSRPCPAHAARRYLQAH